MPSAASMPGAESMRTSSAYGSAEHHAKHGYTSTIHGEILARVMKIDASSGMMEARGDDGIERRFMLDPKARRSAWSVKADDTVKIEFDRDVTVSIKPQGEKAKRGMNDHEFDATVVGMNPETHIVSLQGPRGNMIDIDVEHAEIFDKMKVNTVVHVDYGRPMAMSVTRP
ncbi:hypothetical protein [Pararobbsia silviterrae]|nr:hypothetical protein [Pararobbsia silviterrae]